MKRIPAIVIPTIVFVTALILLFFLLSTEKLAFISDREYLITSLILISLELVGLVFAIYIVVFILLQYFRYRRRHRLVFEAFSNEPELVDTENKPLNLSMLAREELIRQFKIIYNELRKYSPDVSQEFEAWAVDELFIGEDPSGNNIETFVTVDQIKESEIIEGLKKVIESLKDSKDINLMHLVGEIAPKEISPIVKFIEAVIPPHTIRATGHLQGWRDIPGRVGITFEFVDLGNRRDLMVRTIWWSPAGESDKANNSSTKKVTKKKVTDYYIDLLSPAMHWMALMFWEQKLLSQVPPINRILNILNIFNIPNICEKRRQARILYLLGALYYAHADQFKAYKEFFRQLAVEHFRQASVKDSSWPLPYLYLANLYSFKAQESTDKMYEKLLKEAQDLYEQALKLTKETNVNTRLRIKIAMALAELASGVKINKEANIIIRLRIKIAMALTELASGVKINKEANIIIRLRIKIAMALTELASGVKTEDEGLINKAIQEVEKLKKQLDPADFDPDRADCAAFLYNLAIFYEIADDYMVLIPNGTPGNEARRYLAYSLVRSRSLWDKVKSDESFKSMREERVLEKLLKILKEVLDKKPQLAGLKGQAFKSEIDNILEKVDHTSGRSGS